MKKCLSLTILCMLFLINIQQINAEIFFSEKEWNFGVINSEKEVKYSFVIENRNSVKVDILLLSDCECLNVEPREITLAPNEEQTISCKFEPYDYSGNIEKFIIIRTTDPELSKALFLVKGFVKNNKTSEDDYIKSSDSNSLYNNYVEIDYYYSLSCNTCRTFLNKTIPALEKEYQSEIKINAKVITDSSNFEELQILLKTNNSVFSSVPVLISGNRIIQGNKEINSNIDSLITNILNGNEIIANKESNAIKMGKIKAISVLFAGLLDGINPCAFTTIIFLMSSLALAGKTRKEILVIGASFTFAVFICYTMIGLGFFKAIQLTRFFSIFSIILKYALSVILVIFAGFTLYDYIKIKEGKETEILLQLSFKTKQKIHESIRKYRKSSSLIFGSIFLGFIISLFELGCTGQIYFPTIIYLTQTDGSYNSYMLLMLYNFAFIIPLIIVFAVTYAGVSSNKIAALFRRNISKVKIGTFIFFIITSILVLI